MLGICHVLNPPRTGQSNGGVPSWMVTAACSCGAEFVGASSESPVSAYDLVVRAFEQHVAEIEAREPGA